jgi:hypothetical protein
MSMKNQTLKTKAITGQNQFTDWVRLNHSERPNSFTAAMIDDSTTLNVVWVVQARPVLADGTTGNTIDIYTSPAASSGGVQTVQLAGMWEVRVGVKTGGYTAGTAVAYFMW